MAKHDRTDWLDPATDVTADNGHTTTQSPEYDVEVTGIGAALDPNDR